jgi:glycine betaine/choline ABC-type transport system substrate-binding protein
MSEIKSREIKVPTAVVPTTITVVYDAMSFGLIEIYRRFGGTSCLHLQIKKTVVEVTVDVPVFKRVRKTAKSDC